MKDGAFGWTNTWLRNLMGCCFLFFSSFFLYLGKGKGGRWIGKGKGLDLISSRGIGLYELRNAEIIGGDKSRIGSSGLFFSQKPISLLS